MFFFIIYVQQSNYHIIHVYYKLVIYQGKKLKYIFLYTNFIFNYLFYLIFFTEFLLCGIVLNSGSIKNYFVL